MTKKNKRMIGFNTDYPEQTIPATQQMQE